MAKKKSAVEDQWGDFAGFDSRADKYVRLDTDAWLRDHGIREEARKRGEGNFPPPDTTEHQDDLQFKILSWVNQRGAQCQRDVSRHLSDFIQQLNDIEKDEDLAILEHKIAEAANDAHLSLEQRLKHDRGELTRLDTAIRQGTDDYETFRKAAGLRRLPDYSGRANAFAIIGFCTLTEVVLNASLLMEVNPFGLLGAVMQMGLITAVNIVIGAFAMGFALRCRNLVSAISRAAAWLSIIALSAFICAFNLLVGHFRESMREALDNAVTDPFALLGNDTWPRMLSDPFGLESSFQSSLLVIVGVISFAIASWKGYQIDDPYPGYGRRDRQLNAIKDNYRRALKEAVDGIKGVYGDCVRKLEDIRHRLEVKKNKWKDLCDRGKRIVDEYPVNLRRYQDDLNYLIAAYRTENRRARDEPPPSYFGEPLKIDDAILVTPSFAPPPETSLEGIAAHINTAIEKIQAAYGDVSRKYQSLEDITAESFDTGDAG